MSDRHLSESIFGEDGAAGEPGATPPVDGQHPQHRVPLPESHGEPPRQDPRHRRRRPWLPLLIAFVLVVGCGAFAFTSLGLSMPSLGGSSGGGDYAGSGTGSVEVEVKPGDSGGAIGSTLQQAGVVKSASTFAQTFATNPAAAKIQPGTYKLKKEMSSDAALTLLLTPSARVRDGVTVREGLWALEIYALLAKKTGTPLADYTKVDPDQLGLPAAAHGEPEGFLFPSTYDFRKGESATDQLRTMVTQFKNATQPLNIRADQLRRIVTIGSLVQAESRLGADGPKVARVVENRMKPGGETNGRLQFDSTVHYFLKKRGTLSTSDKERATKNPYNTYLNAGLPPGPIGNPGLEAIKAAQNPTPGDWLYFVTVNPKTGKTLFAHTLKEQLANEKTWHACEADPSHCE